MEKKSQSFRKKIHDLYDDDEDSFIELVELSEKYIDVEKWQERDTRIFFLCVATFLMAGGLNSIDSMYDRYNEIILFVMGVSTFVGGGAGMAFIHHFLESVNLSDDIVEHLKNEEIIAPDREIKKIEKIVGQVLELAKEIVEEDDEDSLNLANPLQDELIDASDEAYGEKPKRYNVIDD